MALTNIAKTTLSRVFLTESKSVRLCNPFFRTVIIIGGVSGDYGDREPVYCQSPYEWVSARSTLSNRRHPMWRAA